MMIEHIDHIYVENFYWVGFYRMTAILLPLLGYCTRSNTGYLHQLSPGINSEVFCLPTNQIG